MRQMALKLQAGFVRLGRESVAFGRIGSSSEPNHSRLDNATSLAWRGIRLCNTFVCRWLNLCEVGVDELFYAFRVPWFFAAINLEPATVPQGPAAFHSARLAEDQNFLAEANSSEISRGQSNSAVSWRTPWLYFVFLLLIWLLLF